MARKTPLAPIVVTSRARRILGNDMGRVTKASEVWAARTTDGVWDIIREEIPGTPWAVVRRADKADGGSYGSLRKAREAIACGWAETEARVHVAGGKAYAVARATGGDWKDWHAAQMKAEHEERLAVQAEREAKKVA